ncbi:uncharacterized protein KY384_007536 [Bacidia gigantensis]|uniref:uncharacterized protein n=1 Tax=Bacidia gigantensis TaxID=2732470 RepID=UPI001D047733|nr:uncharacterized protein KY384_007536 [Bacidia gigantensis]KAG8527384.1 hypothetical protein KY384_007536 [Bacidia gigantensis]
MSDYTNWTCEALRRELEKRKLPKSGIKSALIGRLLDAHNRSPNGNREAEQDDEAEKSYQPRPSVDRNPPSLADLGILSETYEPSLLENSRFPKAIQDLFYLVAKSKKIDFERFGRAVKDKSSKHEVHTEASRHYDRYLKQRAASLSKACSDSGMDDQKERGWSDLLCSRVFLPFKRVEDENLQIHHCFACRRYFPALSRPHFFGNDVSSDFQEGKSQRKDLEICESRKKHLNISNCELRLELAYKSDECYMRTRANHIPDATLGLCTYNFDRIGVTSRGKDWLDNDLVVFFQKHLIRGVLDHFPALREPYQISGEQSEAYSFPMFAFGLWEAKRAKGAGHEDTVTQTCKRIKSLLIWQREIFDQAQYQHSIPIVWFFSSIGADWRVYGCIEDTKVAGNGYNYRLLHLWSGISKDKDSALQLLCIVDLLKFWVDYTYKPIIGTCISRLQSLKNTGIFPSDKRGDVVSRHHIPIDAEHTPWAFSQRRLKTSHNYHPHSGTLEIPHTEGHGRRFGSSSPISRPSSRASQRSPCRSTTPADEEGTHPESDMYTWILDRDPGIGDLFIIRINQAGYFCRPIFVFDATGGVAAKSDHTVDWDSKELKAASAIWKRYTSDYKVMHRSNKKAIDYLWRYFRALGPMSFNPDTQITIILPLKLRHYRRQDQNLEDDWLYESLEVLLKIPTLLAGIDRQYDRECSHSSKCHGSKSRCSCDARLHLTRAVRKVCSKHQWPNVEEVSAELTEIRNKLDLITDHSHRIRENGVKRPGKAPRSWAVLKDNPEKFFLARPLENQLLSDDEVSDAGDAEETSHEEDSDNLTSDADTVACSDSEEDTLIDHKDMRRLKLQD